ncbi:hypothetical protein F8S09_16650 [Deinococcus sp. SDU3-2]|uniref:Knr4/Smi1-like domain-containing protein n=1 Tax=Deinococcus terrestris TaxID=2651870 RepID=A0A7X1NYT3_9DEIO|nr:SMI1/KNR4 family protein [Deinococcus terrestris]MPY68287.1 hypothetical protein [Deinococcus terrestris]
MSALTLARVLAQHFPQVRAHVRAGVTSAALDAAETSLGFPFPQEVRDTYQAADGQDAPLPGVLLGLTWLPLDEVVREHAAWLELAADDASLTSRPAGAVQPVTFSARWLPFASDGAGNGLAVDLDPGPAGKAGQIITYGPDERERLVLAPNLPAFFCWVAEQIGAGRVTVKGDDVRLGGQASFLDAARILF